MEITTLSDYCKKKFGTKVYRLSLSTGCNCPNRDGKVGYGGCTFCSENGSGEFTSRNKDINIQIKEAKMKVNQKFPKCIREEEKKYIAYFQSFTNTYGDTKKLEEIFLKVARREDIVALSIATRPDCLEDEKMVLLNKIREIKPVWVELGLQTINEDCARKINRCYTLSVFNEAYKKLKENNIDVIVHVILGLPYETREDSLATVRYLSGLKPNIDGIKIHLLHVVKGTRLAKEYEENPFPIMSLEEYSDLLIECLKILPKEVVIHRLTGDGDKKSLVAPLWSADKKRVLNTINNKIKEA